jgi:phage shock protein A
MPDEPIIDAEVIPSEPTAPPETGYSADGVPTFDAVREKIETRYATSVGSVELASETPEGRTVEEPYDARQKAAAERLAQIRASMSQKPDTAQ